MVGAVQVRAGDLLERRLVRDGAEVDDGVDAGHRALDGGEVGQVGDRDGLRSLHVVRRLQIAQAQFLELVAQRGAQHAPDPPAGPGHQHASWLHGHRV